MDVKAGPWEGLASWRMARQLAPQKGNACGNSHCVQAGLLGSLILTATGDTDVKGPLQRGDQKVEMMKSQAVHANR